ncbi:MAG: tripartite tricarboxylate transporter TctB family protein [Aquincola tertiaricarbonis]|uniref:tripartite tricarboxylate transporter TctB family protein n=1 Tax=Aquincola TaxID=391952 RepID=UPI000615149E|nr:MULTISPECIES: tripartite tricarboxylate transporter TctB family protein [Aquincola]MCR5863890.1 tripartite tricarboxylate transporter TctB family protein [Aquincola sp. J276]
MQIKLTKDLLAGVMFTVAGICFAVGAASYSFGSAARPGPGYFPFGLGILLALMGAVILVRGLATRQAPEQQFGRLSRRPLPIVVLAILSFALTLPTLGMVLALPILIAIISAAGDQFSWRDVAIGSVVLTLGSWLVFIKGLALTLPVWPSFIG